MSEIPKTYDPSQTEDKWYAYWMKNGFFRSIPDEREPYTIVIPPPNVTGVLHMGHMLNNTIQDVLIRRARMLGKNACWVPGTDHASIATEAKVVAMLKEKGINKKDLSREDFLKYAWEWKEKYGGIILDQLKKLGASCDWDRTRFTMEDDLSDAVIEVFIDLYQKGQIYRGVRMVNWDPLGKTALSDEEVIHKEVNSRLVYVRYAVIDATLASVLKANSSEWNLSEDSWEVKAGGKSYTGNEFITIATVRPETILGDTGVCVHPEDPRYSSMKGKFAVIPMVNRPVPIVFDTYIEMEFGTGALKVTPAHDINDYNLGVKYNLEVIDTINDDGSMSPAAQFYIGEDRFTVRKKIVKDLETSGHVTKVEDYRNKVGYSERTDAVIEPKLSMQWFLKMDTISKPALENVLNGNVKLIPDKFINTYKHWMENVHDWCISRQLWWGQRIPAWYDPKGRTVVTRTSSEAIVEFKKQYGDFEFSEKDLRQDEDVLDTWFSSWLWPISVFDGFKDKGNKDIKYYYPTNDLVTAPEILFFWVARMIIAGYEWMGEKPFSNVYLTGIVRDKQGRKMSKSLGNSPDPLDLIKKYSADGVRVGMLLSSPAGNDLLFDEALCEQGRNFANKIWNAFRLVKGWNVGDVKQSNADKIAIEWFHSRMAEQVEIINDHYSKLRMSDALMSSYKLIWDDFCSWYLEMVKPDFVDGQAMPVSKETMEATIFIFENLLKVIHPWMPFISEELWHLLRDRVENDCLIIAKWPIFNGSVSKSILDEFNHFASLVNHIRNIRVKQSIKPSVVLNVVSIKTENPKIYIFQDLLLKVAKINILNNLDDKNLSSFFIDKYEYLIPVESEIIPINQIIDDFIRNQRLLFSVNEKLNNEKFIKNATSQVIAIENKKRADSISRLSQLEHSLKNQISDKRIGINTIINIKESLDSIKNGTFEDTDISRLLINLRDYLSDSNTSVIRDLGDFISHPVRQKGFLFNLFQRNYLFFNLGTTLFGNNYRISLKDVEDLIKLIDLFDDTRLIIYLNENKSDLKEILLEYKNGLKSSKLSLDLSIKGEKIFRMILDNPMLIEPFDAGDFIKSLSEVISIFQERLKFNFNYLPKIEEHRDDLLVCILCILNDRKFEVKKNLIYSTYLSMHEVAEKNENWNLENNRLKICGEIFTDFTQRFDLIVSDVKALKYLTISLMGVPDPLFTNQPRRNKKNRLRLYEGENSILNDDNSRRSLFMHLGRGDYYVSHLEPEEIEEEMRKFLVNSPDELFGVLNLLSSLIDQEKFSEAKNELKKYVKPHFFDNVKFNYVVGLVYYNSNEFEQAINYFLKVNSSDEPFEDRIRTSLEWHISMCYMNLGDFQNQLSFARKVYDREKTAVSIGLLINALLNNNLFYEAKILALKLLEENPSDLNGLLWFISASLNQNDLINAEAYLAKAEEINSKSPFVYLYKAELNYNKGQMEDSIVNLNLAKKLGLDLKKEINYPFIKEIRSLQKFEKIFV